MAQVNQQLLFGYEVRVGMKAQPSLEDVFGLYQLLTTMVRFVLTTRFRQQLPF